MIILDTNVLSELMQRDPDGALLDWLDRQPSTSIWITVVTVMECRFGIARLPAGRRQDLLAASFETILSQEISDRILSFEPGDAQQTASLMAQRRKTGRPVELGDSIIAGIARARRAQLATRNTRHFDDAGISLINPWET